MKDQPARRSGNPAKRALRSGVRLALQNAHLRKVVAVELRQFEPGHAAPSKAPVAASVPAAFVDRHGRQHALDPDLRNRLKPGWRVMVDPEAMARQPDDEALRRRAIAAERVVREACTAINAAAGAVPFTRVLEIGCYDGSAAFQLARATGAEVVATDLARYYVVQQPGRPADKDLAQRQVWLAEVRDRARVVAGMPAGAVRFVEDDVTATTLEPASFDVIVSFEVLEHVRNPAGAFASMAALLRPGGVMYHDYNPFFSAIGGHSLCTLDFPWGHVRLDDADFERYVQEIRPAEAEQALRFYRESLNRMTLGELGTHVAAAGLELAMLVPWHDRARLGELSREVLEDVRRVYPAATAGDLLATFAALVARRPAS